MRDNYLSKKVVHKYIKAERPSLLVLERHFSVFIESNWATSSEYQIGEYSDRPDWLPLPNAIQIARVPPLVREILVIFTASPKFDVIYNVYTTNITITKTKTTNLVFSYIHGCRFFQGGTKVHICEPNLK